MALDLILMGPPGAGKGTQAGRVAAERGLAHIATGDMLRAAVRDGTPLGLEAKAIMARGDLVSDDLIIAMFRERLAAPDTSAGVLLDGFPRTEAQAEALDEMLTGLGRRIAAVVVFDIDEETVVRRLSGRRMCRAADHVYHVDFNPPEQDDVCDVDGNALEQRPDDAPEKVKRRLEVYHEQTAPLEDYYDDLGVLQRFDGTRSPDEVREHISATLSTLRLEESA